MGLVGLEDFLEVSAQRHRASTSTSARRGSARRRAPRVPTVDWKASFPDTDGAGDDDAAGYEVRTGTTTDPVLIDFDGTPLIGVSADRVLLQISDFVHVSGSFAFRLGPVLQVDVATGLNVITAVTVPLLATITNVTDTDDGSFGRSTDFSDALEPAGQHDPGRGVRRRASSSATPPASPTGASRTTTTGSSPRTSSPTPAVGFFLGEPDARPHADEPGPVHRPAARPAQPDPAQDLLAQGRRGRHRRCSASRASSSRATASRVEVNLGTRFPAASPTLPAPAVDYAEVVPRLDRRRRRRGHRARRLRIKTGTTTDARRPHRSRASSSAAAPRTSTSSSASSSTSTARSTSSSARFTTCSSPTRSFRSPSCSTQLDLPEELTERASAPPRRISRSSPSAARTSRPSSASTARTGSTRTATG